MTPDDATTTPPRSLCDTCQLAGKGCEDYDPQRPVKWCEDYRFWTRDSIRAAMLSHARGSTRADWRQLCRLIELEKRLCL